jgi:signal transduction histidine kinase
MCKILRALVIEDLEFDRVGLENTLQNAGRVVQIRGISSSSELIEELKSGKWDMIFSNSKMSRFGVFGALEIIHKFKFTIPLVIITDEFDEELIVKLIKAGAYDVVIKGKLERLVEIVNNVLEKSIENTGFNQDELIQLQNQTGQTYCKPNTDLKLLVQLTSGFAHEVRNPLNAISVVMEALFQETGEKQELLPYREHIFTHIDRLKKLMQNLLELSKPLDHSKRVLINLGNFIKNTVEIWNSSPLNRGSKVIIDNSVEGSMICIFGEPSKLQQVFMNVFENADQNSSTTEIIEIMFRRTHAFCTIFIRDRGVGIKDEHIDRVFEPFFTTRRKGTGLGLSIVKHIVTEHNGIVVIKNCEAPSGCVVEIQLPIHHVEIPKPLEMAM